MFRRTLPFSFRTLVGESLFSGLTFLFLMPSRPSALLPQAQTVPSAFRATEKLSPREMAGVAL